jgi:hypothetical protein
MTVKTSRHPLTATAAVALVAMLGMTACNSDPSAKRVAQDLVRTLTQDDPEVRDCMLEVIDGYSEDDLEDIGNDAREGDQAEQAEANQALAKFQADLEACRR